MNMIFELILRNLSFPQILHSISQSNGTFSILFEVFNGFVKEILNVYSKLSEGQWKKPSVIESILSRKSTYMTALYHNIDKSHCLVFNNIYLYLYFR